MPSTISEALGFEFGFDDFATRVGWVFLHSLWQGVMIAGLLFIALRLMPQRSPWQVNARYLLAVIALVSLPILSGITYLCPPIGTASVDGWASTSRSVDSSGADREALQESPRHSAISQTLEKQSSLPSRSSMSTRPIEPSAARESLLSHDSNLPKPNSFDLDPSPLLTEPVGSSVSNVHIQWKASSELIPTWSVVFSEKAVAATAGIEPWLPLASFIWCLGVILASLRMVAGWMLTRNLVATAEVVSDGLWLACVERWCDALGIEKIVRILASSRVSAPVVVGWIRPVILWPAAALTGISPNDMNAIIVHELTHIYRRDTLVNLLQACIEVLYFHHPAVWYITAVIRSEREYCADDLAVRTLELSCAGTRLSYVHALVAIEERRSASAFAVAANGGLLLQRIRRLAGLEVTPLSPIRLCASIVAVSCLIVMMTTWIVVPVLTGAEDTPVAIQEGEPSPFDHKGSIQSGENRDILHNPWDIKSLNPTAAKTLVEQQKKKEEYKLDLASLKMLDAPTARMLRDFYGHLYLNGLRSIEPEVVEALATPMEGQIEELGLDGLDSIDVSTAKSLSKLRVQRLSLCGLKELDSETAKSLAGFKGELLVLDGLTSLDDETAIQLADCETQVSLAGLDLESVTRVKRIWNEVYCWQIRNNAISTDHNLMASPFGHWVLRPSLTDLDRLTARAIARSPAKSISIDSLSTLNAEAAAELALYSGALDISEVNEMSDEAIRALATFSGTKLNIDSLLIDRCTRGPVTPSLLKLFNRYLELKNQSEDLSLELEESEVDYSLLEEMFSKITVLDLETAEALRDLKVSSLSLSNLKALDTECAKRLSEFRGDEILLPSIHTIDTTTAAEIAGFNGNSLVLSGLTSLDAATTRALMEFKGHTISLDGLADFDKDSARALAEFKGRKIVLGLTAFNEEHAHHFLQYTGQLYLPRINSLDVRSAEFLSKIHVGKLSLDELTSLDSQAAKALAGSKCDTLTMNKLRLIDSQTAASLAYYTGELQLDSLIPDTESALELSNFKGESLRMAVWFLNRPDGLSELNVGELKLLIRLSSDREVFKVPSGFFNAITSLDEEVDNGFSELRGSVWVRGLSGVDDSVVKALAKSGSDSLMFSDLPELNAKTASAMAEFKGEYLSVDVQTTLDREVAVSLAEFKGKHLSISCFGTMDQDIAALLANFKGSRLSFPDLAELDAKTAESLARFQGNALTIGNKYPRPDDEGGLNLSEDTAKALLSYKGSLHIYLGACDDEIADILKQKKEGELTFSFPSHLLGLKIPISRDTLKLSERSRRIIGYDDLEIKVSQLDPNTAAMFAEIPNIGLSFDSVTELDIPTAKELAALPNPSLSFTNLKSIDRDILDALADYRGNYLVLSLPAISAETARQLGLFKVRSLILKCSIIDADAASMLANFQGDFLTIDGFPKSNAEVVAGLSRFVGRKLSLPGIRTLDRMSAEALANFKGDEIRLDGLVELSDEVMLALSGFKGDAFSFFSLLETEQVIDDGHRRNAARLLCDRSFRSYRERNEYNALWLPLKNLDESTASFIGRFQGDSIWLDLTYLTPDAARMLTAFPGELTLNIEEVDLSLAKAISQFRGKVLRISHPDYSSGGTIDVSVLEELGQFQGREIEISNFKVKGTNIEQAIRQLKTEHQLKNGFLVKANQREDVP